MNNESEIRVLSGEIRLAGDAAHPQLVGYAARYNSLSDDLGGFREVIRPGAFTRSLGTKTNVPLLTQHNSLPLASTGAGTLKLNEDEKGLAFTADLEPTDPDVQRILPKLRRGDLRGMSFRFDCNRDSWRTEGKQEIRELHDVDLGEISLVTAGAYPAAGAALRSLNQYREERDPKDVKVNGAADSYAHSLITSGAVDTDSSWEFSAEDGNHLLGPNGDDWEMYSKTHLGVDADLADKTKAKYKYPFAKLKNGKCTLFRSGLVAVRQRGANVKSIFDAAGALLELVDKKYKKEESGKRDNEMDGDDRSKGDPTGESGVPSLEMMRMALDVAEAESPLPYGVK